MNKLIRQQAANSPNVIETRNLDMIKDKTGNLYESISIIAKRANQINISIKAELHIIGRVCHTYGQPRRGS